MGQLVLARKIGERIVIGKDVTVTVLSIQGGVVRLGFAADKSVPIMRSELLAEGETQIVPVRSPQAVSKEAQP